MGNFVVDGTVLPGPKAEWDGVSIIATHPEMFITPAEYNVVRKAINDLRTLMPVYHAAAYLHLDGVTEDSTALNALLQSMKPTVGQNPPLGGIVLFPPGAKVLCAAPIVVPNWCGLSGTGGASSVFLPTATFNGTCLIRNELQDGTGEYISLRHLYLDGGKGLGAICSDAVVQLIGAFINSDMTDCIATNGSARAAHFSAKGTPGGAGPLLVDNCWFSNCNTDGVVGDEDATNTGAVAGFWFRHIASENHGSNHAMLVLAGVAGGRTAGWRVDNYHCEMGGVAAGGVALKLDGVARVVVDSMQILGNAANTQTGIVITNHVQNVGLQIRSVTNINAIPMMNNLKDGYTIGALNLDWWVSSDVKVQGGLGFQATAAGTGGRSTVIFDSAGTARFWFDGSGLGTGNSVASSALALAAMVGASIDRPLALLNAAARDVTTGASTFTFEFPSGAGGALQVLCNGTPAMQISPSGAIFLYGNITVQGSLQVQGNLGLYNHAVAAKPTVAGAKVGNGALTSLIAALVALGQITDSTTT